MFDEYHKRWKLVPDGDPIITATSRLLPVRSGHLPAMLKVVADDDEKRGNLLMAWWDGRGAAQVLAHDGGALLMERARAGMSLVDLARNRRDDEASRIMCEVMGRLHAPRGGVHSEIKQCRSDGLDQLLRKLNLAPPCDS
jgi:streptomycin 6-kinase